MGDEDPPPHNRTSPPRAASTHRGFSRCQGHPRIAPHQHWRPTSPYRSCSSPVTRTTPAAQHRAVGQGTMPLPCSHPRQRRRKVSVSRRGEFSEARRRCHGFALLGTAAASPAIPKTRVTGGEAQFPPAPSRHGTSPTPTRGGTRPPRMAMGKVAPFGGTFSLG